MTEQKYDESAWSDYLDLCRTFRNDGSAPSVKELQNEEIISGDGFAKSGFVMFRNEYDGDDTLISCRLWQESRKSGTVLDSSRFKGSLAAAFQNALYFIERNTKTGWKKTEKGGREEIRSYPREAVREALVNAIAHRDYSIAGTQIDIDIFPNRIDIVSPGSWLLPRKYEEYPVGAIPSIRRNAIIAACLDVANLMERGGTGFQTMVYSYSGYPEDIKLKVLEFVLKAETLAYEKGAGVYQFRSRQDYLGVINRTESYDSLRKWFIDKISESCQNVKRRQENRSNGVIDKAKDYILANFQRDISLDDISREIDISPYYFSKIFKENTGENFIDYLTTLRIDKAKELLETTDMSMKELCGEVGYANPNYFSRIFKKIVGLSPTEYKDKV